MHADLAAWAKLILACAECGGSIKGTYDPNLVGLSYIVAIFASYVALDLSGRVSTSTGAAKKLWLFSGATMMGLGIWSMHFIGMLAFVMPMPVTYDLQITFLSMLAGIFGSGLALYIVSRATLRWNQLVLGGLFMGVAINSMHYIGMKAMRMNATTGYEPILFAASVVIAIVASWAALWLAYRFRAEGAMFTRNKAAAALLMGTAIVGMHYTGMAAAIFKPATFSDDFVQSGISITGLGGTALGAATIVAMALTLLSSLVEMERRRSLETLTFLAEASKVMSESIDFQSTLARVAKVPVPSLADWAVVAALNPDGRIERLAGMHKDPDKQRIVEEMELPPDIFHSAAGAAGLRQGRAEIIPVVDQALFQALPAALAPKVRQLGVGSCMIIPMLVRSQLRGLFLLVSEPNGRQYGPADLTLAEELAARAALAIENARLYDEAQLAIDARDKFLSIASHELNTPLTTLKLKVQTFERRMTQPDAIRPEQITPMLKKMRHQVDRLSKLVSELLDVSRITAGRMDLNPESVDLAGLVRDVVQRSQEDINRAGSSLELKLGPVMIGRWDRLRLEQIVQNLLSNALKYGDQKPIQISLESADDQAILRVRDHGIGIPPEAQTRIFERFVRAANERHYSGFGLGLWIVKMILDAMHGTIEVASEPGDWTLFTVRLPFEPREIHTVSIPPLRASSMPAAPPPPERPSAMFSEPPR